MDTTWCKCLFKTIKNAVIFEKNISINGESHFDQELFKSRHKTYPQT
jgi:hypothetical protein